MSNDQLVLRFGRTERFVHWWTMTMLVTALLSGLGMGDDAGSGPLLWLHVGAVVLIGAGLIVAFLFGNRRALVSSAREVFLFNRLDVVWVRDHLRRPLQRPTGPRWGKFNTGQKLLAWALGVSVVALIVTGIKAWSAHSEGSGLHATAAALSAVLLTGHIFMAVVNPATRPALRGMMFGRVSRSWAAKHHPGWLDDQSRKR